MEMVGAAPSLQQFQKGPGCKQKSAKPNPIFGELNGPGSGWPFTHSSCLCPSPPVSSFSGPPGVQHSNADFPGETKGECQGEKDEGSAKQKHGPGGS